MRLAQIDPLVSARNDLEVAQHKFRTLDGIDEAYETFAAEGARLASLTTIDRQMIIDFVDQHRKDKCGPEIARLDRELQEIGDEGDVLEERKRTSYARLKLLISQVSDASATLVPVENALQTARTRANVVQNNASSYERLILEVGYPPADNEADFAELRQLCWELSEQIVQQLKAGNAPLYDAIQKERNSADRVKAIEADLTRVRDHGSPIPFSESEMRERIVAALGVSAKQMPYVAELMEIADGRQRWQLAAEKVLRRAGLTLLVPQRYYRDVLAFANANNMRGYLKLREVVAGARIAQPQPGSLASMLQLADPSHECAAAAITIISKAGDFLCADSTADFERFARAVTDTGLMQTGRGEAIKDDRDPLRASQYLFQGDVEAKMEALAEDLAQAQVDRELARTSVTAKEDGREDLRRQQATVLAVYGNYPSFSEIDALSADREVAQLSEQLEALLQDQPDLAKLQRQADEQEKTYEKLVTDIGLLRQRETDKDTLRTALMDLEDSLSPVAVSDRIRAELGNYVNSMASTLNLLHPETFRGELVRTVENDQTTLRCVSSSELAPASARILAPPCSAGSFGSGGGFAGA